MLNYALQAASLAALPGIRHAFFTRQGGVSEGIYASLNGGVGSKDAVAKVAENRARMAGALHVAPDHLLSAYQVHSSDAMVVDAPWPTGQRPKVDALVTRTPGIAVGASTADCAPVLFADPQARVVGAAHAGWRGALSGILEATVDAMERCGAAHGRIVAALGPTIRQPNYEVGPEFIERFVAADADNVRLFTPSARPGHAQFDLAGYIAGRLAHAGIASFEDLGRCNYAEPDLFFSYRRSIHRGEPDYGRHINAIALASD